MKISEADILLVPGLGNASADHWQRRWLDKMSTAQWVEQDEWDKPLFEAWIDTLEQSILRATRPVILVGHGLGAVAIVHAAQRLTDTKVKGAFLVCPPDLDENRKAPKAALPFANIPRDPLPFPSLLIASQNDPHCTPDRAADFANAWGSESHIAGEVGQLNSQSGHGPWPEGLMMFMRLMGRV